MNGKIIRAPLDNDDDEHEITSPWPQYHLSLLNPFSALLTNGVRHGKLFPSALLTNGVRHNFREPQLSPLKSDFGVVGLKMTAMQSGIR